MSTLMCVFQKCGILVYSCILYIPDLTTLCQAATARCPPLLHKKGTSVCDCPYRWLLGPNSQGAESPQSTEQTGGSVWVKLGDPKIFHWCFNWPKSVAWVTLVKRCQEPLFESYKLHQKSPKLMRFCHTQPVLRLGRAAHFGRLDEAKSAQKGSPGAG